MFVYFQNELLPLNEFCEKTGIKKNSIYSAIKRSTNKNNVSVLNQNFSVVNVNSLDYFIKKNKTGSLNNLRIKICFIINSLKQYGSTSLLTDYQEFYDYIKPFNNLKKAVASYYHANRKNIWMCDTESIFTYEVPPEHLFKDNYIITGDNKIDYQENNFDYDKIKTYYANHPEKKPYLWAFCAKNITSGEKVLLNYYQAVNYFDNIMKPITMYYHNLTWDEKFISRMLIDECQYRYVKDEDDLQPRTIYTFINDSKTFKQIIMNSHGIKISIECTWLKTSASVKKLGEILNLPKDEMNYHIPRSKNHQFTEREKAYIFRDVDIVIYFLNHVNDEWKRITGVNWIWKITLGATAMNMLEYNSLFFEPKQYRQLIGKKQLSANESKTLRPFYSGGYANYNIIHLNHIYHDVMSLDIRSAYPDKEQHYQLPYGKAIYDCQCDNDNLTNNSDHFKLYVVEIKKHLRIKKGQENMLSSHPPDNYQISDYFPFMIKGTHYFSQYKLKIFLTQFEPNPNDIIIKKIMCFKHKLIKGLKNYVDYFEKLKNQPNLKKDNPVFYEFVKLMLNALTGKFGQKEIEIEYWFTLINNIQTRAIKNTYEFDALKTFSYLPLIIAITDMTRLQLLSLINEIGWENWIISDTDSCKFLYNEKYEKHNNPKYLNLITNKWQAIYGEEFGYWDFEYRTELFKCVGKKKYCYLAEEWDKEKTILVKKMKYICAGATDGIKEQLTLDNFQVGFEAEKIQKISLNGLPVLLPNIWKVQNIYRGRIEVCELRKDLLHRYYRKEMNRIANSLKPDQEQIWTTKSDDEIYAD